MKPGNLLKLYGGLYGEDGDFICFADGYGIAIKHHYITTVHNRRPNKVGEHLEVYYGGSLGFCLPQAVIEIISNENR
tara:strand:+ start:877 stop:1107 length:231 start_codon:yes stop_codon:yes gene_type:complete